MDYADKLILPLQDYHLNGGAFLQEFTHNGRYWGVHLGEDVDCPAGTPVRCVGNGRVVYSALHAGAEDQEDWGNVIIVEHQGHRCKAIFYSLYAHIQRRMVQKGQKIRKGHFLGGIGKAKTPENGFWEDEHLHFAIYTGQWTGEVLPGYWINGIEKTKPEDWQWPKGFIENYNAL